MRCPNCGEAELVDVVVAEHNIGPLVGITAAILTNAPVLRCPLCGETTIEGALLDAMQPIIAESILSDVHEMDGEAARYLRKFMGLTQEELAARMRVSRDTVLRWEKSVTPLPGPEAMALCQVVRRHQMREIAERMRAILEVQVHETASRFCDLVVSRKQLGVLYSFVRPDSEEPCLFGDGIEARRPLRLRVPSEHDDCPSSPPSN